MYIFLFRRWVLLMCLLCLCFQGNGGSWAWPDDRKWYSLLLRDWQSGQCLLFCQQQLHGLWKWTRPERLWILTASESCAGCYGLYWLCSFLHLITQYDCHIDWFGNCGLISFDVWKCIAATTAQYIKKLVKLLLLTWLLSWNNVKYNVNSWWGQCCHTGK